MKMRVILALTVILALLSGCAADALTLYSSGSASDAAPASAEPSYNSRAVQQEYYEEMAVDDAGYDGDYDAAEIALMDESGDVGGAVPMEEISTVSRKIIMTYDVNLQTKEFESGYELVETLAGEFDGFVQSSYVEGMDLYNQSKGNRYASFTLRIPSERSDAFIARLGTEFNVTSKQQYGEDITDSYYDIESRLNNLRVREERLTEMLEEAEELEYLLEVDREWWEVHSEIERLTASLQRMDSYVALSTVTVYLQEVVEYEVVEPVPVTFGERISQTFTGSWQSFLSFLQGCVLAVIWMIPFLLLMAIGVVILIIVIRVLLKRAKTKKALQASLAPETEADPEDSAQ